MKDVIADSIRNPVSFAESRWKPGQARHDTHHKMPTALDLAQDDPALQDAVRRCRKLLNRRALFAAAASTVPVPGLDWAVDAGLMSKLIPDINAEFGLTPKQIGLLPDAMREEVQKALALVGSVAAGKYVTREVILRLAKAVGRRLTVQQAAKYVPIAGQAVSAVLGYSAMRYLGEEHIKDCVRVVREAQLALPEPAGRKAARRIKARKEKA